MERLVSHRSVVGVRWKQQKAWGVQGHNEALRILSSAQHQELLLPVMPCPPNSTQKHRCIHMYAVELQACYQHLCWQQIYATSFMGLNKYLQGPILRRDHFADVTCGWWWTPFTSFAYTTYQGPSAIHKMSKSALCDITQVTGSFTTRVKASLCLFRLQNQPLLVTF